VQRLLKNDNNGDVNDEGKCGRLTMKKWSEGEE
jgi:hypothetical protein